GAPSSNTSAVTPGARGSYTLLGPPERMIPLGLLAVISASGVSNGRISQYTRHSRTLRAINWVYCAPKSRITISSSVGLIVIKSGQRAKQGNSRPAGKSKGRNSASVQELV